MSNAEHYAKERALKEHIATMLAANLRDSLLRYVNVAEVRFVDELADALKLPSNHSN